MNKKDNPTDGFLILQYRKGSTTMLQQLVSRYHKTFCQKAYWITKDKEMAKDIAQDCWITIINNLDSLENVDRFKSWSSRIVYTKSIDALKSKVKAYKNLKYLGVVSSLTADREEDEIHEKIMVAIQNLSKDKQDIIRLFYSDNHNVKEISKFLDIPVGTVKSRLFKAREKLKSILKK